MKLPLILDGATGTQLQRAGMPRGACPELWILENPKILQSVQKKYAAAGSDIVYAPTFGANRVKLDGFGAAAQTAKINKELVKISKEAVGDSVSVAGDLAPFGLYIEPFGEYDMNAFIDIYAEQALALEEAGVNLFVIETSMTVAEARAAFIAIRRVSEKPVFVTFTCDKNGRTMAGADIRAALVIFQAMGAAAFGLNCSSGPVEMLDNIRSLAGYAGIPLIAKPNAGLPEVENGETLYKMTADDFVGSVREFAEAGVSVFGGCCGTNEEHIARLSAEVKKLPEETLRINRETPEYIANEKTAVRLSDARFTEHALKCDETLEDALMDCAEFSPRIRIESTRDADMLEKTQHASKNPVLISCDDTEALPRALISYNGRAAVETSIDAGEAKPICDKYGAVLIKNRKAL